MDRQKPFQLFHSDACGWTDRNHSNYSIRTHADEQTEAIPIIQIRYLRINIHKPPHLFHSDTSDGQTEAIPTIPFGCLRIDKQKPSIRILAHGQTEATPTTIPFRIFAPSQLFPSDTCGWTGRTHPNYSIRTLSDRQIATIRTISFGYLRMDRHKPSQLFHSDICTIPAYSAWYLRMEKQ